jgi:hypothetical protein
MPVLQAIEKQKREALIVKNFHQEVIKIQVQWSNFDPQLRQLEPHSHFAKIHPLATPRSH